VINEIQCLPGGPPIQGNHFVGGQYPGGLSGNGELVRSSTGPGSSTRSPRTSTEGARKVWALLAAGNPYAGGDFLAVGGNPLAKFAVFPVI
jgi:hypothetical protein